MVTKNGSILHEIYGPASEINSFHHQSIKDLATGLEVIAYDPRDRLLKPSLLLTVVHSLASNGT